MLLDDETQTPPPTNESTPNPAADNPSATSSSTPRPPEENANTDTDEELGFVKSLDAIHDVPLQISAILGHTTMQVKQVLKLGRGAIIELDRRVGEAIDIYVNDRLVARGEVVVVDDDRLGVTMTEILKSEHTQS